MSQTKGHFSLYNPYISTKTPVGREIQKRAHEENRLDVTITEVRSDEGEIYLNERLILEIGSIRDDEIRLESIPEYIQNQSVKSADYVVYEVHSIRSSGRTLELEATTDPNPRDTPTDHSAEVSQSVDTAYSGPPSLEILESITAEVLGTLGYQAETNVQRSPREQGGPIEVDVFAENPTENFSIYVSCKNWNSKVDRQVVDKEVGRIMNMQRVPQLRVMVAGELTDGARGALEANGFVPITLGEQADETNAEEIHTIIHTQLTQTLLAIAPPQVEAIASQAESLSNELSELSDEIRRIGD